jgi:oligosaccharyltransferase complex subunit epsilon
MLSIHLLPPLRQQRHKAGHKRCGLQYVNVILIGYFPFNAFLAAFFTCLGGAVLAGVATAQDHVCNDAQDVCLPVSCAASVTMDELSFVCCAVCLRMQLDSSNQEFKALAPERACADFILAHLALVFIAWNYIG